MVRRKTCAYYWISCLLICMTCVTNLAYALAPETSDNLAIIEDTLTYNLENKSDLKNQIIPILLSPPEHFWRASRDGFEATCLNMLKRIFPEPGSIIPCPECDQWRLYAGKELKIQNGPISLMEAHELQKKLPAYSRAKSLGTIRETSDGTELLIVSLTDGSILFHTLADAQKPLNTIKPWNHYAQERERRERGESLSYVFINLGFYPHGLVQMEFVEQWGSRNQHISGLNFSLYNPNFALGLSYHYVMPNQRFHMSGSLFYSLSGLFSSMTSSTEKSLIIAQGMANYAIGNTFGVFLAFNTENKLSIGVTCYNPILLPFLL